MMNIHLLLELGRLWRTGGDASLVLELDDIQRTVHVHDGALAGVDSNAPGDGLLDLLVQERRIGAAAAHGISPDDAARLITHGWLTGDEAAAAVGRVALVRFERALSMSAHVQRLPLSEGPEVLSRPLGPLLVDVCRTRLTPDGASRLIRELIRSGRTLDVQQLHGVIDRLELLPTELRRARALALGAELATLAQSDESAPLVAALMSVTSRVENARGV